VAPTGGARGRNLPMQAKSDPWLRCNPAPAIPLTSATSVPERRTLTDFGAPHDTTSYHPSLSARVTAPPGPRTSPPPPFARRPAEVALRRAVLAQDGRSPATGTRPTPFTRPPINLVWLHPPVGVGDDATSSGVGRREWRGTIPYARGSRSSLSEMITRDQTKARKRRSRTIPSNVVTNACNARPRT
jgi:hypothetical protein